MDNKGLETITSLTEGMLGPSSEELSILDSERWSILKDLERTHPPNPRLITANDILRLCLVNTAVAIAEKTHPQDPVEIAMLKEKGQNLVRKVCWVVTRVCLSDAWSYPNEEMLRVRDDLEPYPETELAEIIKILDEARYEEAYQAWLDKTPQDLEWWERWEWEEENPFDYVSPGPRELVVDFIQKLHSSGPEAQNSDIKLALKLVGAGSAYGTWRAIASKAIQIIENIENGILDPLEIEKLLMMIHQGGYESLTKATEVNRPLLEQVTDRPWQVANVFTGVFAGLPRSAPAVLDSETLRLVKPFRDDPLIRPYLFPKELGPDEVALLFNTAVRISPYFRASVTFNRCIPTELLAQVNPWLSLYSDEEEILGDVR